MADITMTLDEYEALRRLITSERESEGAAEQAAASKKRTRKKTAADRKMSAAMKQARAAATKKNGDWRKGWDNSKMMKHAHKLKKKM